MIRSEDMQALVLLQDGQAVAGAPAPGLDELVALRSLPVPRSGPGQVLVRVALSPVNPSDLLFIQGAYGQPRVRGRPAGFEGTGVVVATGDAAAAPLIGRRVSFLAGASGAWAGHALADAASCVAVADALRDEDAAALLVNPLSALAMIDLAAQAQARAVVLTAAASQLGRLMVTLARERGLATIALVRRAEAAAPLRSLGADEVLVTGASGFAEQFAAALRAHKPRVLLDAVGDDISAEIFDVMPAHSRWVAYGVLAGGGPRLRDMGAFVFAGKRIEGFWLSRWLHAPTPEARAQATQAAQQRFLDGTWHTPVAERVPLRDALRLLPAALERPGKVLLAP